MSSFRWQSNRLFSLQLRNGRFALLQMLAKNGQVAVFDCFRDEDSWDGIQLDHSNILFCCWVLKSVRQRSVVKIHRNIAPVEAIEFPETTIDIGDEFREMTLWEGTADERSFLMMGEGSNSLRRIGRKKGRFFEEYTPIELGDYEAYAGVELTNLRGYPEFNERLYLCSRKQRNFDPLKELAFNRPLDIESKTYVDIIAGKTRISTLGY
jgi:hypothetical protein